MKVSPELKMGALVCACVGSGFDLLALYQAKSLNSAYFLG